MPYSYGCRYCHWLSRWYYGERLGRDLQYKSWRLGLAVGGLIGNDIGQGLKLGKVLRRLVRDLITTYAGASTAPHVDRWRPTTTDSREKRPEIALIIKFLMFLLCRDFDGNKCIDLHILFIDSNHICDTREPRAPKGIEATN